MRILMQSGDQFHHFFKWSLRQTQGQAPGPLHADACLNPLLNNMLNKTPIKSLRIACKALSLDTPPTIPLMGLIGVFR